MTSLSVFVGSTTLLDVPVLDTSVGIPQWVSKRGGDVRAYDLRENRNVLGPAHHFRVEEDIRLTNGLLRADCGPRNVAPYLTISVYKGGAWRAMGYLYLADVDTLAGARLVSVTPERAVLALSVRNEGTVFIHLYRGERGVRVVHGAVRDPSVVAARLIQWRSALIFPPGPGEAWGDGTWGAGNWGGTYVDGGFVNGSPRWYGREYETTVDGGTDRYTDANGLTRGLASLRSGLVRPIGAGLAMQKTDRSVHYAAFVATSLAGDDIADYQQQLASANEQETRIR